MNIFCGKQGGLRTKKKKATETESVSRGRAGEAVGWGERKGGDVGRGEIPVRDERKQETRDM